MSLLRGLADAVGRLARLLAPLPDRQRPLTEDDIRTDQFLRAHGAGG